jgi:hypothetical protein
MSSGDVSRNFGLGRVEFSVWRPLNSSNLSSGDVSRNFGLGRVEFSRHVWRPLNSSNYELRRRVEKFWTWSGRIFSTRLETP